MSSSDTQAKGTVLSMVVSTEDGDRPNNPGIVQQAQSLGLLDYTDATKLGEVIQQNPQGSLVNFAHAVFSAVAFTKEQEKQAILTPSTVSTELDLIQYLEKIAFKAHQAGFTFTVSLVNGKMVPAVQKAAPAASA